MKSLFAKSDNSVLMISIAIGSAAVGAAAYLFTTEKGAALRRQLADKLNGWLHKTNAVEKEPAAYLQHPHKHRKSDIQDILEHGVITEQPGITG